jgi:radical SAM protein with 4Fe4S-binding SPASM domain
MAATFLKKYIPHPIKRWLIKHVRPQMMRYQYIRKDYPAVVGVNFSINRCFLKCKMCPQHNTTIHKQSFMNVDLFKKIVDQLPNNKPILFELSSYGETLLVAEWRKMLEYAVRSGKKAHIVFVTNGVGLTDGARDFILDNPPDIVQVSIDAATQQGYKWLTGSDAFNSACKNLSLFAEEKKNRKLKKPYIHTHIIACKEFESEIKLFIDTWKNVANSLGARPLGNWGGVIDDNGITPLWSPPEKRYPCFWPFYATKIMPDGEVHKCHIHFLSGKPGVGSLQNESIESVWKGKRVAEVRKRHLEGAYNEEPMCEKCNIWALVPNIWKQCEYKETKFIGKRYPHLPPICP